MSSAGCDGADFVTPNLDRLAADGGHLEDPPLPPPPPSPGTVTGLGSVPEGPTHYGVRRFGDGIALVPVRFIHWRSN